MGCVTKARTVDTDHSSMVLIGGYSADPIMRDDAAQSCYSENRAFLLREQNGVTTYITNSQFNAIMPTSYDGISTALGVDDTSRFSEVMSIQFAKITSK